MRGLSPLVIVPKTQLRAARHGDHFVSERAAKCVPMAGGSRVTSRRNDTQHLKHISGGGKLYFFHADAA